MPEPDPAPAPPPPAYREFRPDPALAGLVECVWTIRSDSPVAVPRSNRVLPDGCMDLIFNLGDPPLPGEGAPNRLRSYVVGAMSRPLRVWLAGEVDLVGVRFRPGGAAAFVRPPARELVDGVVPLTDLWRREAAELEARLFAAGEAERVSILLGALGRRAAARPAAHPVVARASALIARSGGTIPIAGLERALGVSRRHLERLFARDVGLSPKAACRVARFRAAVRRLRSDPGQPWARLAVECGFFDQAHLIRDFRAFSGLTPAAFRAEQVGVASVQSGGEDAA